MSDWIKCSERLPNVGERVLMNVGKSVFEGWHDGRIWVRYDDFDESPASFEELMCKRVTHWMPLPEPPEEE